jgi:hypothetical protein
MLFYLSVAFALSHFVFDLFESLHVWSLLLITLAAALPVVGAGIRTFRTAYEFARNTIRFRAKRDALTHLEEKLQKETEPEEIFRDLWRCEQVMKAEHREWLSLMIEAEWFG